MLRVKLANAQASIQALYCDLIFVTNTQATLSEHVLFPGCKMQMNLLPREHVWRIRGGSAFPSTLGMEVITE
jgi:hypothetical protein